MAREPRVQAVRWVLSAGVVLLAVAAGAQQTAPAGRPSQSVIVAKPGAPGTVIGGKVPAYLMPQFLAPVKDAATESQIREYLKMSGEIEAYRERLIGALDQQRSKMPVYWPESFWQDVKAAMRSADFVPMYVTMYQHGMTKTAMQGVIDGYRALGAESFAASPVGIEFEATKLSIESDTSQFTLNNTAQLIHGVYVKDKAQMDLAKAQYEAQHGVSVQ